MVALDSQNSSLTILLHQQLGKKVVSGSNILVGLSFWDNYHNLSEKSLEIVLIENHHWFSDLKQYRFIIWQFWGQRSDVDLTRLKSTYQQGCAPLEALEKNWFLCLFQLLKSTYFAWFMVHFFCFQSQQPHEFSLHLCPHLLFFYFDFLALSFNIRIVVITLIIQDNLPSSASSI